MKSFKDYYVGTLFRPRQTFDALVNKRQEFFTEALALEAAIKTEIDVFSVDNFHSPVQGVDLRKLTYLLEEAKKDDTSLQ
jgi:hypothetical protein